MPRLGETNVNQRFKYVNVDNRRERVVDENRKKESEELLLRMTQPDRRSVRIAAKARAASVRQTIKMSTEELDQLIESFR